MDIKVKRKVVGKEIIGKLTLTSEDIDVFQKVSAALRTSAMTGTVVQAFKDIKERLLLYDSAISDIIKGLDKDDQKLVQNGMDKLSDIEDFLASKRDGVGINTIVGTGIAPQYMESFDKFSEFLEMRLQVPRPDRSQQMKESRKNEPVLPGANSIVLDPQDDADRNRRMNRHYMALSGLDQKLDFIVNGAFDRYAKKNILDETGKKTGETKVDSFSKIEKKIFNGAYRDFFKPAMADGTLAMDPEEFDSRMEALARKIAKFYKKTGEFIENGDMSALIDPQDDAHKRYFVAYMTNKESIQATYLTRFVHAAADKGNIDKGLMTAYCQKHGVDTARITTDKDLADAFKNVFDKSMNAALSSNPKDEADAKYGEAALSMLRSGNDLKGDSLSPEEKIKVIERSNDIKAGIASEIKNDKPWLHPENNIDKKSLQRLDNLYDQISNSKRTLHSNSNEFKALRDALKEAHEKFGPLKGELETRELNDKEKKELVSLYDKVSKTSEAYLKDKKDKKRGSDLGQERYEIAFAALQVTNAGSAKYTADYHNRFREAKGERARKVSLDELMARSNRTHDEQKTHEREKKEAAKNRRRSRNVAQNNGNMI